MSATELGSAEVGSPADRDRDDVARGHAEGAASGWRFWLHAWPGAQLVSRLWRKRWIRRLFFGGVATSCSSAILFVVLWFACPFPIDALERWPQSRAVRSANGELLLERPAADQQWRTPVPLAEMSLALRQATIAVEDARFRSHCGVDPWSVLRAVGQNLSSGSIVSGASTLTMQVCRMLEPRPRVYSAKGIEAFRALQLERLRSKDQILEIYLNIAPYGGNIRGVEAASRYYFDRSCAQLSLAESALLAGIPQSPNRLRPDRHPERALTRRAMVLRRMRETDVITEVEWRVANSEPLELRGAAIRGTHRAAAGEVAWHVSWRALKERPKGGKTTLDLPLQRRCEHLVSQHLEDFPEETEAALVVIEVRSGHVLAWIGSPDPQERSEGQVDGVLAWRSPGSTLKPFLYGVGFQEGRLHPDSEVHDIPIERGGWRPRNFDNTFQGSMPVTRALQESRNVPALLVCEALGVGLCRGTLEGAGLIFRDRTAVTGLTLATGGVEVRLIDLTNLYATLARGGTARNVRLFADDPVWERRVFDAEVCHALTAVLSSAQRRPWGWEQRAPSEVPEFMWKTGTSSGRRDAWAVGHNGVLAVGVWIGDFAGRGNERYVGRESAEPLLAQCFDEPWLRARGSEPLARSVPEWVVSRPLPIPQERARPLRILSPEPGAVYRGGTRDARVVIHAHSNRDEPLLWFVDGKLYERAVRPRLELTEGKHELRAVTEGGEAHRVHFFVGI